MKKNLLELCLSPDKGGLELYVQNCAHAMQEAFNVITVLAHDSKLKPYVKTLKTYEITRSIFSAYALAKIIDREKIDLVHLHWTKDLPVAVLAKLLSKQKPKLVQTRHMTMTRFKNDFYHKFLYKNLDAIVCVTKAVEEQIVKFIPASVCPKVQTLYLGVSQKRLLNENEIDSFRQKLGINEEFIVSIVGRINELKGQHLLIEALKILLDKGLNVKAYIVGHAMKEEYLQGLQEQVKRLGLKNYVVFTGFSDEASSYMQISDAVVMASKNETFGLVSVEAMACNTALIASNSGGAVEIIDDNETGLLFEPQNAYDLSKKIELLYNNKELKTHLAKQGFKKASDIFNANKQFQKLAEFMQKGIDDKS
jgi:glycosyltransferase involved in cell wall biosynthesis